MIGGSQKESITLTKEEEKIIDILLCTVEKYQTKSTIRIVGGWVRDKLRGLESMDIDITIDNMTGVEYSRLIRQYVSEETTYQISSVGVIKANPKTGKHLETATLHIDHIPIDICSLRKKEGIEIKGNQKEKEVIVDALGRDFTINAIFYRLNRKGNVIEDPTGKGIEDLKKRIIRTPLRAIETLQDDPLRMLRALRFAGNLKGKLEEELARTIKKEELQERLSQEVSRERIGKEIVLMSQTKESTWCLEQIIKTGMFTGIFGFSAEEQTIGIARSLEELMKENSPSTPKIYGILATILLNRRGLREQRIQETPEIQKVIMEKLKLGTTEKTAVQQIFAGYDKLVEYEGNIKTRLQAGKFVQAGRELWKVALALFTAEKYPIKKEREEFKEKVNQEGKQKMKDIIREIEEKGLERAWEIRPLMNGTEVASVLKKARGPWLKGVLERIIEFQLERPEATKTEVEQFLKEQSI